MVGVPISQPRRDVVIPAQFDPLVLTMTMAEARQVAALLIEAAGHSLTPLTGDGEVICDVELSAPAECGRLMNAAARQ